MEISMDNRNHVAFNVAFNRRHLLSHQHGPTEVELYAYELGHGSPATADAAGDYDGTLGILHDVTLVCVCVRLIRRSRSCNIAGRGAQLVDLYETLRV